MSERKTTCPVAVRKSNSIDHIAISIRLACRDWRSGHAKIEAGTAITTEHARDLARELIALADSADARKAAKATSEARRRKWRDREIAAGRMIVLGARR